MSAKICVADIFFATKGFHLYITKVYTMMTTMMMMMKQMNQSLQSLPSSKERRRRKKKLNEPKLYLEKLTHSV